MKSLTYLALSLLLSLVYCSDTFANTYFDEHIPKPAYKAITDHIKDGISIFTFAPNGGWLFVTKKGELFDSNIPSECKQKIHEYLKKGHTIEYVGFPPKGGNRWIIVTNKTTFSRNIPDEAFKKIQEFQSNGQQIKLVAFPTKRKTDNSWLVLTKSGDFFARNIDDELYQVMRNLRQTHYPWINKPVRTIDYVAFTADGGWLLAIDDYYYVRNIDNQCFSKMNLFRNHNDKIDSVTFSPENKCWSVISNSKFKPRPSDPIRAFENNINGYEIWVRMRATKVPGASVAVVINDKIAWSAGYGFLRKDNRDNAVHPETIFQAASISKLVTAIGALKLTELNFVGLEENIQNGKLRTPIPINRCLSNPSNSITIKGILNHRSGIDGNVTDDYKTNLLSSGKNCPAINLGAYNGYPYTTSVANLPGISNIVYGASTKPNTVPVKIIYNPSTYPASAYSGPAFSVLQQLTRDLTRQKYEPWMKTNVLNKMGMTQSLFTTEPEKKYADENLTWGYLTDKNKHVRNRYPEAAAAGLYTNATELANVLITLNANGKFKNTQVISEANAQLIQSGLGTVTKDRKVKTSKAYYSHSGSNAGYRAFMIGFPNLNDPRRPRIKSAGIVVMTNGNNTNFSYELVNAVIAAYGWN